ANTNPPVFTNKETANDFYCFFVVLLHLHTLIIRIHEFYKFWQVYPASKGCIQKARKV
ncbi:MAG: hypothetical protein JWQ28_3032, partial [Pedobacter sp.]|nr:hypothetical protein [Pedobacter sp.]